MEQKTPRWEAELWSYLSKGDGIHCPVYQSCRLRRRGTWCLSDNEDYYNAKNELLDNDDLDVSNPESIADFQFHACPRSGRIFRLIIKLAKRYRREAAIDRLPVPDNVITTAYDSLPIEVRRVPLKAHHGTVWRLPDCWVIQLNSNDSVARQRFTLYHEIFHILAHCKASPVFKKRSCGREGNFNELLADHFSACMLLPKEQIEEIWPEVKDISRMAAMCEVPRPVMYLGLRGMGLI